MLNKMLTAVAVSLLVLGLSLPAFGEEPKGRPATKEELKSVTDTVNNLVKVCKAKDKEKIKKSFLTKSALEDVKKDPSTLDFFMDMCVDFKVNKNTKATVDGNKITLETTTKDKTGTMTETHSFTKEDGQWKVGK